MGQLLKQNPSVHANPLPLRPSSRRATWVRSHVTRAVVGLGNHESGWEERPQVWPQRSFLGVCVCVHMYTKGCVHGFSCSRRGV